MKPRKRTNEYWARRAEEQLSHIEQLAMPYLRQVDTVYIESQRRVMADIKRLYERYYLENGFDPASLRAIAPNGDIMRFIERVNALGIKLPIEYQRRLTRLQLLGAQMWLEGKLLGTSQMSLQTAAHLETIYEAQRYSIYNLSKGTGIVPTFSTLDKRTTHRILTADFHGANYSQRIWKNTGNLAKDLKKILGVATATGQSPQKTIREVRDRYGVARYQASRLIRTETNHFNTEATVESYRSVGIEQYAYIATLDSRTSEICQELDGKHFPISDTEHRPPQHANCRSTIRAVIEGFEPDKRIMRTDSNRYIPNMSYKQWKLLYS